MKKRQIATTLISFLFLAGFMISCGGGGGGGDGGSPPPPAPGPTSIRLSASSTDVLVGTSVTLTAITDQDLGPSGSSVIIFEGSTQLTSCRSGTQCTASVSSTTAGRRDFFARLIFSGGSFFPSSTVSVTWNAASFTVSLSTSSTSTSVGTSVTLTATANQDVGSTPFFIRILDGTTEIASCGSGTRCVQSVTSSISTTRTFVAKVARNDGSDVQATSSNLSVTWSAPTATSSSFTITFSASATIVTVGTTVTLTATTNQSVGPTQFFIQIFEGSNRLNTCGSGTECSTAVTETTAVTKSYVAKVARSDGTDVQATSNTISVTWSAPSPPPAVTASIILNSDESSDHVAQVLTSDRTVIDIWVQRDENGQIDYVSDYRLKFNDGTEAFVQLDALSRPSYFEDQSGKGFRVHFYLEGDRVDVTYFDSTRSQRVIVDLSTFTSGSTTLMLNNTMASANLKFGLVNPSQEGSNISQLQQSNQLVCGVLDAELAIPCNPAVNALFTIIGATACVGTVGFGCPAALIITTILGEILCETFEAISRANQCDTASEANLAEPESPILPPTTGEVSLQTGEVHITLTWDNATDVDLHVIEPSGEEIFFSHKSSATGGQLDVDDIDGFGPENIFWPEGRAPSGQYIVDVVYFASRGRGLSNYTVTVRRPASDGRQLTEEFSGTLRSGMERQRVTTFRVD